MIIFGLRFFGQGFASHLSMVLCGKWFSKNRGKTVAFTSLGFTFGEALLPIIFVTLIGVFGGDLPLACLILVLISIIIKILLTHERTPSNIDNTSLIKK